MSKWNINIRIGCRILSDVPTLTTPIECVRDEALIILRERLEKEEVEPGEECQITVSEAGNPQNTFISPRIVVGNILSRKSTMTGTGLFANSHLAHV